MVFCLHSGSCLCQGDYKGVLNFPLSVVTAAGVRGGGVLQGVQLSNSIQGWWHHIKNQTYMKRIVLRQFFGLAVAHLGVSQWSLLTLRWL